MVIGIAAQELRWRWSDAVPTSQLVQAEHEFQAGDNKAAVKLFDALADKNNPIAQYWLAHMTELGLGVPRDLAKAIDLYKKAAEQNVEPTELRLGEIYLDGNLVPPDFVQAKIYLEKSAYQGKSQAAKYAEDCLAAAVKNGITQDEIEEDYGDLVDHMSWAI